ncbi:MAG: tetratricopeptide repeat protein, partial [Canidatus Methanoxibalbensis ujae]|nr:tetratricopeptide repeat protein [Candidatus Methanoxibalbensis ujae]
MGFLFRKKKGKTAEEWFNLGYKEKDPKKQIEYYSKCLKLDPKNADAWNNIGIALYDLGRCEEAIRCYDRALEIDPKDAVAWYNKGIALDDLGRYEEAIRCYDKALEINPKYANAWNNKGVTLGKLGRYEEAIRCFEKAIEIDPEHEGAKNGKKLAEEKLREQKRKEERERKTAEEYIEKLIEREDIEGLIRALKDRDAGVRANAAEALGEIGDERAVEPLIKALKDSDESVREGAALALGEIGDKRAVEPLIEALEDSKRSVRRNAAEALEIIASNAIYAVDSLLVQARNLRINTKSEEEKLNEAKHKLDKKNFSNAVKLANECKNSLERKINEYKQISAKQSIDLAYSEIKEAEKLGINVSDAKDLHKKAILEFDNREYEKAIEYAERSRKDAEYKIRRYNHAKEQIEASKDIVKSIKKLISIPKAEELIENAESALKVGNYNNAVKFAEEAKKIALERKSEYDTAFKSISEAEVAIEKAKEFGYCDTSEAEELLNKARKRFEEGNYAQSISDARKSEEIAWEIRAKSKPEIEVVLPEKTFKPNYWKRLDLIVRNKGNAHAKAVKIEFSKEVEVKGLEELDINSGEEKKLSIVLKPKEVGDVPLEIKTTYKDADGKEYSMQRTFLLNVTEPAEAKKEEERKRARKAHAFFPAEL